MEYQPMYCGKCGRKLVWKQDEAQKHNENDIGYKFDKYDPETGEQQIVGWWECPQYRWWQLVGRHDSYKPKLIKENNEKT